MICIRINGTVAPQGSKNAGKNGGMYESSKALGPWREAVRAETQRTVNGSGPERGPVVLSVVFYLNRPRNHYRSARGHEHEILPSAPPYPDRRPDLDKLVRAVMDGLKAGGAYADDCQVVAFARTLKDWADEHEPAGCLIQLEPAS